MREQRIPGDYAALAAVFEVKVPSIYGWIDSGRIAKTKLPKLVEWSGRPLEWWLNSAQPSPSPAPDHAAHALARLQVIGRELSESDWQTIIQVAQQLASKSLRSAPEDPQQALPQVLPEYQETINQKVREAHEHAEKARKRYRAAPG